MTQTATVWETEILLEYLQIHNLNITKTFVDVGAGDGVHQSNSREFIKQGWDAVLIDGLQENVSNCRDLYQHNRKVICLNELLSDVEEHVHFEKDKRHWALSQIKKGETPNRKTIKLSRVLTYFVEVGQIGILSLDIEGNEGGILKDLLENNIYPEIIIVEGNTFEAMQEHRDILAEHYTFAFGVFPNQVFKRKDL
jgi:FkbM family methyltransferase